MPPEGMGPGFAMGGAGAGTVGRCHAGKGLQELNANTAKAMSRLLEDGTDLGDADILHRRQGEGSVA